jgi:hypothetical protein
MSEHCHPVCIHHRFHDQGLHSRIPDSNDHPTLAKDYERIVHDEEYSHLVATYLTQKPPNNVVNQRLIYNNAILVYEDSDADAEEWKDVHPALQNNKKFKDALARSQS